MFTALESVSEDIIAADEIITQIDTALLYGFAGGRQREVVAALGRIFTGSPLEAPLRASLPALGRGELQEPHFVALAAARAALQGAQYDALRRQARAALRRPDDSTADAPPLPAAPTPLLATARHWLMELAITGFSRLDASTVQPFLATLAQLRREPQLARLAFLLTGFTDELLAALPLTRAEEVPLLRWGDLWATALLVAVGAAPPLQPRPVSGKLYPLGVELRRHAQLAGFVLHGLLLKEDGAEMVRLACSRFKVSAIGGDETWLLFPEAAPLIEALAQGQALAVQELDLLPGGELRWNPAHAQPAETCKLMDMAARYLAPGAPEPAQIHPLPPLERHPIQLAEPVVLTGYTIVGDSLQLTDGQALPLDTRWNPAGELATEALTKAATLFGLLRYDAGRWALQPLAAANRAGKLTFTGQSGVKLFKKPPKNNPVAILEERAGKLLRK